MSDQSSRNPILPITNQDPNGQQEELFDTLGEAMNTVFESLGRALICLGPDFRVVRASDGIDRLVGEGAARELFGHDAGEVLGEELFGSSGTLRRALQAGERREGWGARIQTPSGASRLLSITVAPVKHGPAVTCDPRVRYLIVARAADESRADGEPTAHLISGLVARAPSMVRIIRLIEHLSESEATVLITGESGTGKEVVARALHATSPRRKGEFVAVNCGALPGELLESELFGHVRGAFTGAVRDRVGRFELASEGTLFLDEVGDLPLHLQVKLLRVLQERTFERVGENRTRRTEARILAATNADLRQAVADGSFREDLYYRLRVVPIEIPPLRDRREDIDPLVHQLLSRVCARHGRSLIVSPSVMGALLRYDWPGNVRELENVLEYAVAVCQGQTIQLHDLPDEVLGGMPAIELRSTRQGRPSIDPASTDPERERDRERLRSALDAHRWNREETAEALGISRTTLWRRMRELDLLD